MGTVAKSEFLSLKRIIECPIYRLYPLGMGKRHDSGIGL
jgi:hypothetical protein